MTVKPESNFGRLLMKNIDAQWTRIENRHGGKNYYIVQDTRSKVLKLYGGDKGRELKEKGFLYNGDIKFSDPINWKKLSPIDWKWLGDRLFS